MRFPLIVYKNENSSYNGLLPDFPGCYPMGATLDELMEQVQDAIETWMLDENPEIFPQPSSLEAALPEAQGRPLLLVEVSTAFLDQATKRINITVPRYALGIIDKAARAQGMARSTFLVQAAMEKVARA